MSKHGGEEESAQAARTAAAEYVAITASRLSRMATEHDFHLLAHMLDQAVLEAWEEATRNNRRMRGRPAGTDATSGDER